MLLLTRTLDLFSCSLPRQTWTWMDFALRLASTGCIPSTTQWEIISWTWSAQHFSTILSSVYRQVMPIMHFLSFSLHKLTDTTLGLGKTFIAAVVMFNFYRWYPEKKIVFLAPTKPLVAQQINACYNIIGIPQSDTVELTGENKEMSYVSVLK